MDRHELVQRFITSREARKCRPKTLAFYAWVLSKLDEGPLPVEPEEIELILARPELGPESAFDIWRGLRTFFLFLEKRYGVPNPMATVSRPRRRRPLPRYLSQDQIERVWRNCQSPLEHALIAFLLDSGPRIGEAASLRVPNIGRDVVTVEGKTGRREIPLSPHVRELLLAIAQGDAIWIGRQGPLTDWGLNQVVRRVMQRAGLTAGPHILRHTFAVHYLKRRGNLVSLQRILGHSSLNTTRIYLELLDADVLEDHARASPALELLELPLAKVQPPEGVQLALALGT